MNASLILLLVDALDCLRACYLFVKEASWLLCRPDLSISWFERQVFQSGLIAGGTSD